MYAIITNARRYRLRFCFVFVYLFHRFNMTSSSDFTVRSNLRSCLSVWFLCDNDSFPVFRWCWRCSATSTTNPCDRYQWHDKVKCANLWVSDFDIARASSGILMLDAVCWLFNDTCVYNLFAGSTTKNIRNKHDVKRERVYWRNDTDAYHIPPIRVRSHKKYVTILYILYCYDHKVIAGWW